MALLLKVARTVSRSADCTATQLTPVVGLQ